jgi:hypothetical protein
MVRAGRSPIPRLSGSPVHAGESGRPRPALAYSQAGAGGTSLSSPLVAGLVADAQQDQTSRFGFLNPVLYLLAGTRALRDVLPQTARTRSLYRAAMAYCPPRVCGRAPQARRSRAAACPASTTIAAAPSRLGHNSSLEDEVNASAAATTASSAHPAALSARNARRKLTARRAHDADGRSGPGRSGIAALAGSPCTTAASPGGPSCTARSPPAASRPASTPPRSTPPALHRPGAPTGIDHQSRRYRNRTVTESRVLQPDIPVNRGKTEPGTRHHSRIGSACCLAQPGPGRAPEPRTPSRQIGTG